MRKGRRERKETEIWGGEGLRKHVCFLRCVYGQTAIQRKLAVRSGSSVRTTGTITNFRRTVLPRVI
jgi:hypothetical protein